MDAGVDRTKIMRKEADFDIWDIEDWPKPEEIEHYFLAPPGKRWIFKTGTDTAGFTAEGVDGTEHLDPHTDRVDITFDLWGNPNFGVMLFWTKMGGGHEQAFTSVGDMKRLRDYVRSSHGTILPVAFFIPFEKAWQAVKEFLETDGALPTSVEWVANRDLPPDTFPEQRAFRLAGGRFVAK
jgi:hypothetical protein